MLRPKLKDKYHVEFVPGEGCFLLAETETHVLEGQSLLQILPYLNGNYTVEQIVAVNQPVLSAPDVLAALGVLEQAGHLTEADPMAHPTASAFWSEFNMDTRVVRSILAACPVEIRAIGGIDPGPLVQMLGSFGVNTARSGSMLLVLTDDYLRPELEAINQECLQRRLPLFLMKPTGMQLWIGPLLTPPTTACWRCLESRLRGNREVQTYVERKTGRPGPFPVVRARLQSSELEAYSMAAVQLVRWLVTGNSPSLLSRLLVADIPSFSFVFHNVVKRPQCAACGNPGLRPGGDRPVQFQQQAVAADAHNGVRSESPEATFQRYQHHISPYTGIVRDVAPSIWHGVGPLRVYMAGHNFALKSDQLNFLKDGLRTNSSGKGKTDAQARTSALCEALERYSGVYQGDEIAVRSSFEELGEQAIDPRACMLYSETQYAEREAWLERKSRFQVVPLPFDTRRSIDWTPVWSMTQKRPRYLPSSYLFYNYPCAPKDFFCWADSNGAAAGTTLEEAALQGLFELVERDAVALWWYNRIPRRGVDLKAFDDGYFAQVEAFYKEQNREIWVLDITSDLGIPTFAAISRRLHGPTEDIMMGFGAHADARIALDRAVTELNQFIPALLNIQPDGQTFYAIGDAETVRWWSKATLATEPYLSPAKSVRKVKPSDFAASVPRPAGAVLLDLIAQIEGRGYEVLILDQTRPDIGLPVVKVIVPGLRHFWARFAPGRLYDVAPAMKWIDKPLREGELNPTAMFL